MSRYDLDRESLTRLLEGEPAYRVTQLHEAMFRHLLEPEEVTALPKTLRSRLASAAEFAPALEVREVSRADNGQTTKWLYGLHDGRVIESVLMHYPRHSTVCISSQAGCAMDCKFCATGAAGFGRHLAVGEIVEQVVRAARHARDEGRRLDHVVYMGMGEPLANLERVWSSVERLQGELGLAARHLTISTVGIVPGIEALATRPVQVNLAISLHAANDELRDRLVPINRRYPIAALLVACRHYLERTRRRISFEWAVIDGVNDRTSDAVELATLVRPLGAHVNLIPLNPTAGGLARGLAGSPPERVRAFRDALLSRDVNVTVRRTRGREIDAACGQLAGSASVAPPTSRHPTEAAR